MVNPFYLNNGINETNHKNYNAFIKIILNNKIN